LQKRYERVAMILDLPIIEAACAARNAMMQGIFFVASFAVNYALIFFLILLCLFALLEIGGSITLLRQ
jgi:hypothetical protein